MINTHKYKQSCSKTWIYTSYKELYKLLLGNGQKQYKIYDELLHFLKDNILSNRI